MTASDGRDPRTPQRRRDLFADNVCPSPRAISIEMHHADVKIARTYGFHVYDALVVVSALAAGCETLCTEGLQDGQVIEENG